MTRSHVSLHLEPARGQDWMDAANCKGIDTDLFHPTWYEMPGRSALSRAARDAIAICARCEVARECLAYAMKVESTGPARRSGIYGGFTPQQRANLARRRRNHER